MTLGGAMFVRNGNEFDYCYRESIKCLSDLCDQVEIVVIETTDGTMEECVRLGKELPNVGVTVIPDSSWEMQHGREKLSYFSNIAISALRTDYVFYQQADEVLIDPSFEWVRKAMDTGHEAFMITRWNLWNSPTQILKVPQDRQPCSTQVIRLARTNYRCVDDAESLGVIGVNFDFLKKIQMMHMGFVRHRKAMKAKVFEMQHNIFQIDYDKRIDEDEVFEPMRYFKPEDMVTFSEELLPTYIRQWAKERKY